MEQGHNVLFFSKKKCSSNMLSHKIHHTQWLVVWTIRFNFIFPVQTQPCNTALRASSLIRLQISFVSCALVFHSLHGPQQGRALAQLMMYSTTRHEAMSTKVNILCSAELYVLHPTCQGIKKQMLALEIYCFKL